MANDVGFTLYMVATMANRKILLVESNPRILEMLVDAFVRRFDCNITCVSTPEDALDVEMFEPHSLVVADTTPGQIDAITMSLRLSELSDRPLILMGSSPAASELIEAMRCGVVDFFTKPFDLESLLLSMQRAMDQQDEARQFAQKYHRMRTLVRKVIRDRRGLNRRVELICRDLVGAHKRLALRMLGSTDGLGKYNTSP